MLSLITKTLNICMLIPKLIVANSIIKGNYVERMSSADHNVEGGENGFC